MPAYLLSPCTEKSVPIPQASHYLSMYLMKELLLQLLHYNSKANLILLERILQLPQPDEAIALFSHIIYTQDKWHNRYSRDISDTDLGWHGVPYSTEALSVEWKRSINQWIRLVEDLDETALQEDLNFIRAADGASMAVHLGDVIIQINLHAVHHRAQINKLISAQGLAVPPTDYIYTVLREVDK
jgi:uncharacterized damage-inducible protein DinB